MDGRTDKESMHEKRVKEWRILMRILYMHEDDDGWQDSASRFNDHINAGWPFIRADLFEHGIEETVTV